MLHRLLHAVDLRPVLQKLPPDFTAEINQFLCLHRYPLASSSRFFSPEGPAFSLPYFNTFSRGFELHFRHVLLPFPPKETVEMKTLFPYLTNRVSSVNLNALIRALARVPLSVFASLRRYGTRR
jgi:hypothetical protein